LCRVGGVIDHSWQAPRDQRREKTKQYHNTSCYHEPFAGQRASPPFPASRVYCPSPAVGRPDASGRRGGGWNPRPTWRPELPGRAARRAEPGVLPR
jgi:hypothetical protein